MSRTITIDVFNPASIDAAVREIREYGKWVQRKTIELAKKVAELGADRVAVGYFNVQYDGERDIDVRVDTLGEGQYAIVAFGHPVLIVEFGAGVTYGYGHPNPEVDGKPMGPGTYPSTKGLWNNPKGWWFTNEAGESEHTYGNPPSMTMYKTAEELKRDLVNIAREVFASD